MKRKELLKLRTLEATPTMMKLATEDAPRQVHTHKWGYDHLVMSCKYDLFLRSQVEQGILKVALFSPEHLRAGGRRPVYTAFFDRESRQFITYQYELQKWSESKLELLEWKITHYQNAEQWISDRDSATVRNYLGTADGSYRSLKQYQREIRAEQLRARHRRETDPWDADLQQTPGLPKNWSHWVAKVGIPEHFIYYQYSRKGATEGYCTYCEKEVPIHNPRHNKVGRCPCCRHQITFKASGKAGRVFTDTHSIYLMQKCRDGMMIRLFRAYHCFPKGQYRSPVQSVTEINRSIYTTDGRLLHTYHWGNYRGTCLRWIEGHICNIGGYYYNPAYYINFDGTIYGYTLPQLLRQGLGRTGFMEYWALSGHGKIDPELYLERREQVPQLEQTIKAGLPCISREIMKNISSAKAILRTEETSLTKALAIDAQGLKRLRRNNGGLEFLQWLQAEKRTGNTISDEDIWWLCRENIRRERLGFISDRMTISQICHYIRRQMNRDRMNSWDVLTTWADYLSMAKAFNYDVMDEIVYRPSKLRLRHDELALRSKEKDIAVQAGEVLEKFPHVDEICKSLQEKFSYVGEQYSIVPPENVMAIIREGNTLHHCIANSDRYWDRMETHESYLLFLRKTKEPTQAYYTLEVEPNGTVRQIRTYYDRQNAEDIDATRAFLQEWQSVVARRLTETDRSKAQRSRDLREQEFIQMRDDQVTIRTGDLAGQLLVDVLTADLMENQAA